MSADVHRSKGIFATHGSSSVVQGKQYSSKQAATTVLSAEDWKRLKLQVSGVNLQQEAAKWRQKDKETKHQTSLNMVKNWTNTIEGQRLKRLEAHKIKEIREEEERVKIDEEEAKFQAALRQESVDRAKTLLYYQTDRLKGFHSGLLLSEILKEREAQIAFKKKRQGTHKDHDKAYVLYQEEVREKGKLADMLSAQERSKAVSSIAAYQLKQMTEKAAVKKSERERQLEEQAAIEKEVNEWQDGEQKKEKRKMEDKVVLCNELNQLMFENKKLTKLQAIKEKVHESDREIFSQAKKSMTKMRKTKEVEILQEFQVHQNKMADHIHSIYKQIVSNDDERIVRAVAEQDAKRAREEREKAEKLMRSDAEIDQCCQEMILEQEEKRREQKELEQELLRQRVEQDQKFHSSNLQKQQKRMREAKEVEKFLKAQMVEKSERENVVDKEDGKQGRRNLKLLGVEEDQFQQYVDQVIDEAKCRHLSIYPLMKTSKKGAGGGHGPVFSAKGGVRPSYYPCASPIVELPSYASKELHTTNTQKRMGFNW